MAMDLKDRMMGIIKQRRAALEKEIEFRRDKMHDTEEYWGFGGPYRRQEQALEKRIMQMAELDDLTEQLKSAKKHQSVTMYFFGCRHCRNVTMVTSKPFDDWHECPVCRKMIYLSHLESTCFQIVDTGKEWIKSLRDTAMRKEDMDEAEE